eukprot:3833462-Amphidinium_carterae.1
MCQELRKRFTDEPEVLLAVKSQMAVARTPGLTRGAPQYSTRQHSDTTSRGTMQETSATMLDHAGNSVY